MRTRSPSRTLLTVAAASFSLFAGATHVLAQALIFADVLNPGDPDGNSIRRVGADGTGLATLISTGGGVRGLDFDPAGGFLYWTDSDLFVIRRTRMDGSGQQDLITEGLAFPSALRLDLPAGRIYWGDQTNENVNRSNLDGSGVGVVLGSPFFRGLAIDHAGSRVYWTTSDSASTGRIVSTDLDGNYFQVVVPTAGANFKPGNLALDVAAGKIYWTDAVANRVRRADLNGANIQDLWGNQFLGTPKGLALDLATGTVYFGVDHYDSDSGGFLGGEIRRMGLDGSNQELVVSGVGSVNDIVIVAAGVGVCPADFDGNGHPSTDDIFAFINAWFAADPRADFDHVGGLTTTDIFEFLNAWFAGCQ